MMQQITILGSTGSIGVNTLDVLARHPQRYRVFALTASTQVDKMLGQCVQFRPEVAVMASPDHAAVLAQHCKDHGLSTRVFGGAQHIEEVAADERVDVVMAAIVGAAGLAACMRAALAGKRLLLANKEALVVGGAVFLQAVATGGARLLPIDSEHSAIFQCLPLDASTWASQIDKLILTASGGPFRTWPVAKLRDVTPDQACAHPNWVMGRKISVDSATMMNKALEVIEASYLFGVAASAIDVVIHPQSVIHSMVQYRDGSVVAQLGTPDMRGPISYGLAWPERIESGAATLDFSTLAALTFESIHSPGHRERFPGLKLAWQALAAPSGTTAILNAANEVAVESFLQRKIRFDEIHAVNTETLGRLSPPPVHGIGDLLALDRESRSYAQGVVARVSC